MSPRIIRLTQPWYAPVETIEVFMGLISGLEHVVREGEPMARHTWLRMGGAAEYFAEPTSVEELRTLVHRCREQEVPIRMLGGGSNLLVRDDGVKGMVVHLAAPAFCNIEMRGQHLIAGGGASLAHVISTAVREGLAGLEQLVGIPGTVGGALHGNSGRQHADIGQWTHSSTVMTRGGEILSRAREDLQFAYRQSSLNELVILDAQFELDREDPAQLTKRMQKLWIVSKAGQPTGDQFAGRIFKNPLGMRAADLVDEVRLKGTRVGGAEVSDRNANYIIAGSDAIVDDVLQLVSLMRNRIAEQLGIELEAEIETW